MNNSRKTIDTNIVEKIRKLVRYYLECLKAEGVEDVKFFSSAEGREFVFCKEIQDASVLDTYDFLAECGGKLPRERFKKIDGSFFGVGFLLRVKEGRSRTGANYSTITPFFSAYIDTESGKLDWQSLSLNSEAFGRDLTYEELVVIRSELNLKEVKSFEQLIGVARKLSLFVTDYNWPKEFRLGINAFSEASSSDSIKSEVIFFRKEMPGYTRGLRSELEEILEISESQLSNSLLYKIFTEEISSLNSNVSSISVEPIEIVPLNFEQKAAVNAAINSPLTVITGPPGTGKSQVVTGIISNCVLQGQSVLFTSRNHKAVDVVVARTNSISALPSILRVGASSVSMNAELANMFQTVLSTRVSASEKEECIELEKILGQLRNVASNNLVAIDKFILTRNELDRIDRKLKLFELDGRKFLPRDFLLVNLDSIELVFCQDNTGQADNLISRIFTSVKKVVARIQVRKRFRSNGLDFQLMLNNKESIAAQCHSLRLIERMKAQSDFIELQMRYREASDRIASYSGKYYQLKQKMKIGELSTNDLINVNRYITFVQTLQGADPSTEQKKELKRLEAAIVKIYPSLGITSLSLKGRVPLKVGLYDLAILDEASQCDIASLLPLLIRAKRIAVIGDPQQLKHICTIPNHKSARIYESSGLTAEDSIWNYKTQSAFLLAQSLSIKHRSQAVELLEHHRSQNDIIGFSNQYFYQSRLRIATKEKSLKRVAQEPTIEWVESGSDYDRSSRVVKTEVEEVIKYLRSLDERNYQGTVGVVSPFRSQANAIRQAVESDPILLKAVTRWNLIIDTAHSFQGDERDVILFSTGFSQGMVSTRKGFLSESGNLFNVAITRARAKLAVIGNRTECRNSGITYLEAMEKYISSLEAERDARTYEVEPPKTRDYPAVANPESVSSWEIKFYTAAFDKGIRLLPQYAVSPYRLDFAVFGSNERKLNVEIDGVMYHQDWNGGHVQRDLIRNMRLIEQGWDVMRFWVHEVRDDMDLCLNKVLEWQNRNG